MNPRKLQYFWGIIFLILGLVITFQMKTVQKEASVNNRQKDLKKLQQYLKEEKERSLALAEQLKAYEVKAEEAEDKLLKTKEVETFKAELDKTRFLAGMTDVSGKGITIEMHDSKKPRDEDEDPNDYVIHEWQLLHIINVLRGAGAQAISVNDERLISISELQCAGPTVSVNGVRSTVPFRIKVVGNSDYLEAILLQDKVVNKMLNRGIEVDIKKADKVLIPRYRDMKTKGSNIESKGGQI